MALPVDIPVARIRFILEQSTQRKDDSAPERYYPTMSDAEVVDLADRMWNSDHMGFLIWAMQILRLVYIEAGAPNGPDFQDALQWAWNNM